MCLCCAELSENARFYSSDSPLWTRSMCGNQSKLFFTCAEGGADHLDTRSGALCKFTGPLTGHTQKMLTNKHDELYVLHLSSLCRLAEFGSLDILYYLANSDQWGHVKIYECNKPFLHLWNFYLPGLNKFRFSKIQFYHNAWNRCNFKGVKKHFCR